MKNNKFCDVPFWKAMPITESHQGGGDYASRPIWLNLFIKMIDKMIQLSIN